MKKLYLLSVILLLATVTALTTWYAINHQKGLFEGTTEAVELEQYIEFHNYYEDGQVTFYDFTQNGAPTFDLTVTGLTLPNHGDMTDALVTYRINPRVDNQNISVTLVECYLPNDLTFEDFDYFQFRSHPANPLSPPEIDGAVYEWTDLTLNVPLIFIIGQSNYYYLFELKYSMTDKTFESGSPFNLSFEFDYII